MFIPYPGTLRAVMIPSINEARGLFKGVNKENLQEEVDKDIQKRWWHLRSTNVIFLRTTHRGGELTAAATAVNRPDTFSALDVIPLNLR